MIETGVPNVIHPKNDIWEPDTLTTWEAITFCGDAMVVGWPPQLPLHAIPNNNALIKGSVGCSVLIMGMASDNVRVVDATLDKNAPINKLISIKTNKTFEGLGVIRLKIKRETLLVIFNFWRPVLRTKLPKKTNIIGSMNLYENIWAIVDAGIRLPVSLSYPIWSHTDKIGIK